jgi:hypothetical protein
VDKDFLTTHEFLDILIKALRILSRQDIEKGSD